MRMAGVDEGTVEGSVREIGEGVYLRGYLYALGDWRRVCVPTKHMSMSSGAPLIT